MKTVQNLAIILFLSLGFWYSGFSQSDTLLDANQPSRDSLLLKGLIEQLNAKSRDELTEDPSIPAITDQAIILSERLADTSNLLTALRIKSTWLTNNNQQDAAERVNDQRNMILSRRGYNLGLNLSGSRSMVTYAFNTLKRTLQVFVDSSGNIPFDTIRSPQFQANFLKNDYIDEELDSTVAYWVKIRLKGGGYPFRKHLLLPNGEGDNEEEFWQHVEFYRPELDGTWQKHIGGATVPISERMTSDWRDFFEVEAGPNANYIVYFRLQGFKSVNWPYGIDFRHVHASFLQERQAYRTQNFIFAGILIFQLIFFFFWYLSTKERAFIPYLVYILGIAAYALTSIQFNYWFPNPDFERAHTSLLLLFSFAWLAGMGLVEFTKRYLNTRKLAPLWHKILNVFIVFFGITASLIVIPVVFSVLGFVDIDAWYIDLVNSVINTALTIFIVLFPLGLLFISIIGWKVWKKQFSPAKFYLLGISLLLLSIGYLVYMLISDDAFFPAYHTNILAIQIGIILQFCVFALGLGHKRRILEREKLEVQNNLFEAQGRLLEEQQKVNTAFGRFVPHKFLEAIGRDSVLDVELGDGVEQEVTVFFSDIRGYTRLAETMEPKENFSFLNGYLGRLGPIISDNNGFVNQYYGDGIMAIFMQSPGNALQASIAIQQKLKNYNAERKEKGRVPIKIGIGMHTGPLIMGIIGDTLRMEAGVVSDTVNTAARMEGLTKHFGASILISETVFEGIEQKANYAYRYLGKVQVKGRREPLKVYDFYDGDIDLIYQKKIKTQQDFEKGIDAYYRQDFEEASQAFNQVLKVFPEDKSSHNYMRKAKDFMLNGIDMDWTGVEEVQVK